MAQSQGRERKVNSGWFSMCSIPAKAPRLEPRKFKTALSRYLFLSLRCGRVSVQALCKMVRSKMRVLWFVAFFFNLWLEMRCNSGF